MRPINKGGWPTYLSGKTNKRYVFTDWSKAKKHLQSRTGMYCHLCEMRINNALAVEHIIPRDHRITYSARWENFLLICSFCNSHKKSTVPDAPYIRNYYWPHLNNTLLSFKTDFANGDPFVVSPALGLTVGQSARAQRTIDLYGLDKLANANGSSDDRWVEKSRVFYVASLLQLEHSKGEASVRSIVNSAVGNGFFSIWLEIFSGTPAVKQALLDEPAFCVDRANWFDAMNQPIPRNPHRADPI